MRLTSRALRNVVILRLNRLFLSPAARDIRVFRAVAADDVFRHQVVEIVWDETHLPIWPPYNEERIGEALLALEDRPDVAPDWFIILSEDNLDMVRKRYQNDALRPAYASRERHITAPLPIDACWAFYLELITERNEGRRSDADIQALRHGLDGRFPSLQRITITPAVHGFLFNPLYETPTIRSFPDGFIYPNVWLGVEEFDSLDEMDYLQMFNNGEDLDVIWRGFHVISRILSELRDRHPVRELGIGAHGASGLMSSLFDQPNPNYDAFKILLGTPGFRRLDLAIRVQLAAREVWDVFRNGSLSARAGRSHRSGAHPPLYRFGRSRPKRERGPECAPLRAAPNDLSHPVLAEAAAFWSRTSPRAPKRPRQRTSRVAPDAALRLPRLSLVSGGQLSQSPHRDA